MSFMNQDEIIWSIMKIKDEPVHKVSGHKVLAKYPKYKTEFTKNKGVYHVSYSLYVVGDFSPDEMKKTQQYIKNVGWFKVYRYDELEFSFDVEIVDYNEYITIRLKSVSDGLIYPETSFMVKTNSDNFRRIFVKFIDKILLESTIGVINKLNSNSNISSDEMSNVLNVFNNETLGFVHPNLTEKLEGENLSLFIDSEKILNNQFYDKIKIRLQFYFNIETKERSFRVDFTLSTTSGKPVENVVRGKSIGQLSEMIREVLTEYQKYIKSKV